MRDILNLTARCLQKCLPRRGFLLIYGIIACLRNISHLFFRYGFAKSAFRWASIDQQGLPIPWFTYPAIEYLNHIDIHNWTVFEYGSGNSTLYWSTHCFSVLAAEDDPSWHADISHRLKHNAMVILACEPEEYVNTIMTHNHYDLIIIDGSHRLDCAKAAINHLQPGGMIILDDADNYSCAAKILRDCGLVEVDFAGFNPINGFTKTTSLFLHHDFRPKPRFGGILPGHSLCHASETKDK